MRFNPPHYVSRGTYAICDRCGFKRRLSALQTEWTGLKVCGPCWDPRPPETVAPYVYPEGVAVPDSRPEQPDTFVTTDITPDDL